MFIDTLGGLRLKPVKSNNQYDAARNLPAAFFITFKYSKLNNTLSKTNWFSKRWANVHYLTFSRSYDAISNIWNYPQASLSNAFRMGVSAL